MRIWEMNAMTMTQWYPHHVHSLRHLAWEIRADRGQGRGGYKWATTVPHRSWIVRTPHGNPAFFLVRQKERPR